jgi:pyruvate dehydrogenase phosphatase regulatory subunit
VKDVGSSGLVGNFKHSAQQTALADYSINLLDTLTKEGHDIGWKQCGSLKLARTHDRMTEYRRLKSISSSWGGVECKLMSPEECIEMCPLITSDDVKGGLFVKRDGVLDKEKLRQVLLNEAIKRGVKVIENCQVLKVHQTAHKVEAVETNRGTVNCVYFINAAGFWSRAIGQLSEPYVKGEANIHKALKLILLKFCLSLLC